MKILTLLMIFLWFISCTNQGWIVANLPLAPEDSVSNSVFIEIMDADSSIHWFHGRISNHGNWCYKHQRLEEVKIK